MGVRFIIAIVVASLVSTLAALKFPDLLTLSNEAFGMEFLQSEDGLARLDAMDRKAHGPGVWLRQCAG